MCMDLKLKRDFIYQSRQRFGVTSCGECRDITSPRAGERRTELALRDAAVAAGDATCTIYSCRLLGLFYRGTSRHFIRGRGEGRWVPSFTTLTKSVNLLAVKIKKRGRWLLQIIRVHSIGPLEPSRRGRSASRRVAFTLSALIVCKLLP